MVMNPHEFTPDPVPTLILTKGKGGPQTEDCPLPGIL